MAKKVYDIRPPKVKKAENSIKEFLTEGKKQTRKQAEKKVVHHHKKESGFRVFPILAGVGVVMCILAVYLFFKLPHATIQIWPRLETLTFSQAVSAEKSAVAVDLAKAAIPAEYFEVVKSESGEFPATGNASNEGQASGTITIFNKYDPVMPFTFKAGTHFMSDSGKLFKAPDKIVIPAAKKSGNKVTPGSVDVKVQAVEGGESYNIAPSNFSVPGLKGTAYYYSVYATSKSAMSGGYAGKVKKVTEEDIQSAKDSLADKTSLGAVDELKKKIPEEYVILEDAISSDLTESVANMEAGSVSENFVYKVTAKAKALVFKKSDLEGFARNYIASQTTQNKVILNDSFKIDYSASSVDIEKGRISLSLNFSSDIYSSMDRNSLAVSFMGQDSEQINQYVDATLGQDVTKINVDFWPFWVKSAPKNQKAVDVEFMFK